MRILTALPLLALALVACGDKAAESATDSVPEPGVAAAPIEQNPHIMGFETGRSLDSLGHVFGGVLSRFQAGDTIFVSVRAQYIPAGAKVEAVLWKGTARAAADQGIVGASDPANGIAIVPIRFARSTPWAKGSYEIEVLVDGVSQLRRPIDID